MTRRVLTDAERIASIREVIEAARGDWHEATALLSVGADLNWLLARSEAPGILVTEEALITLHNEYCVGGTWRDCPRCAEYLVKNG